MKANSAAGLLVTAFLFSITAPAQQKSGCLRLVTDSTVDAFGYLSANGDTVIAFGKYDYCFTENFCDFAIVSDRKSGIIGINRKEKILFHVFVFDNGPDPFSDGLFRIIIKGKIGFADKTGRVVIPPRYDCAFPFKNGKARVGLGCKQAGRGEHSAWTGGKWFTINRRGKVISN